MRNKTVHLDIDPELWKEFKTACAFYDIPMVGTLIRHIQNTVNEYRKTKRGLVNTKVYSHKERKK